MDIKIEYGAANQAITLTIASLGNGSARESTAVDNTTNKFIDALVQLKIKSGGSGTLSNGTLEVYAYGTADGGTTFGDGATGSDAAITPTNPTNLRSLGVINIVANATTYESNPMSVARAFDGILPAKWGIVIVNRTGAALDATGGNHAAFYQGVYATA